MRNHKVYKGIAIPCFGWEQRQNSKWNQTDHLDQCIKEFVRQTGIPPLIYSMLSSYPWNIAKANNCRTWVAQYANLNVTDLQSKPFNEAAYQCVIRQYTPSLRISGYNGNLDGDMAYIDAATWDKCANPNGNATPDLS